MYKYALKFLSFLRIKRQLLLQFLLVISAFLIMVIISQNFAADIVSKHIASYGSEVVAVSANTVDSYLTEFCITLDYVSIYIEKLYSDGADIERMKREIAEWTDWIQAKDRAGTMINFYCYVNDTFIDGNKLTAERNDFTQKLPSWHQGAYENYGDIFFSEPYIDYETGERIITVSKALFDKDNKTFGLAAIDVFLSEIMNHIKNMSFLGSGFGLLLDSNRRYLIVPEEQFIGVSMESVNDGRGGFAEMAALLAAGEEITAFQYTRYNGEPGIAFIKQLFNGWYIGLVSPRHVYYKEVYFMRFVLSAAGAVSVIILCTILAYMHIRVNRSDKNSRLKSSFLAKMSHEMRTPMNVILGMSEYLQNEPLNTQQMDYINDINSSASSFLSLIDDLLNISNIESEKAHLTEQIPENKDEIKKSHIEYTLFAPTAKILVVDDNELNIKTAMALFSLSSIIPRTVSSGREAIELIKKENFDIIFMDQMMPEMDGIETTKHIRAWEKENTDWKKSAKTPIIALTANTIEGVKEMFLTSGFDGYISKPVAASELKKILVEWLPGEKVKLTERLHAKKRTGKRNNIFDKEFSKKLRLLFAKRNLNFFDEITKALKEHDITLAHRMSHTLKSNAALLGKTTLQHIAAEIDRNLSDGKNLVTEEQLRILETELNVVLVEFAPLLNEVPPKTEVKTKSLNITAIRKLIEKLEPLIEMGNPESTDFIDSLRQIPQTEKLIEQIEDFDFEEALATLAELKEKYELQNDVYMNN
jgi:CheY-like chemotaxis protein